VLGQSGAEAGTPTPCDYLACSDFGRALKRLLALIRWGVDGSPHWQRRASVATDDRQTPNAKPAGVTGGAR
jgi:hypothetical protein